MATDGAFCGVSAPVNTRPRNACLPGTFAFVGDYGRAALGYARSSLSWRPALWLSSRTRSPDFGERRLGICFFDGTPARLSYENALENPRAANETITDQGFLVWRTGQVGHHRGKGAAKREGEAATHVSRGRSKQRPYEDEGGGC